MVIRKIQKDGNSSTVSLPPAFLSGADLKVGDHVEIRLSTNKEIIISKLKTISNQEGS